MGDDSSIVRARVSCVIAISAAALVAFAWIVASPPPGADEGLSASILLEVGAPVAVIYEMDEIVSNGTTYPLSGGGSYDTDNGTIVAYHWEIEHGNTTQHLYQASHPFVFEDIGLYKIKLTVTDDVGKTGVNFTAVYSVPDRDLDGMADWWEVKYFGGISVLPTGDIDEDGHSNLEEYLRDTNPLVADPPEGVLEQNWQWILVPVVIAVVAIIVTYPLRRKRKKAAERNKMELAIEIQKALDEE